MEIDRRVKSAAHTILPGFLLNRLDPVASRIRRTVSRFASSCLAGQRILDAGCGENLFREYFPHCVFTGVDAGVGDVRWNYSRVDAAADLLHLPFPAATFDGALGIVVLEHVADPGRMLGELARVVKPGGELLLVVPLLWEVHQAPHDYFRFTRFGAAWLLENNGFEITGLQPLGGFFTLAARRCINLLGFFQRGWRWPFFILLAPCFGILLPLLLPVLDRLDRQRDFTLGYEIRARRRPLTEIYGGAKPPAGQPL